MNEIENSREASVVALGEVEAVVLHNSDFLTNPAFSNPFRTYQVAYSYRYSIFHTGSFNYITPSNSIFFNFLTIPQMELTDSEGNIIDTTMFTSMALSWRRRFHYRGVYAGIQPLFNITTGADYWAMSLDLSLGAMYNYKNFYAGLMLKRLGYVVKPYISYRTWIPFDIKAGISYEGKKITVGFDYSFMNSVIGAGFLYTPYPLVSLYMGYSTRYRELKAGEGTDILVGFSTGFSLKYRSMEVSYSFLTSGLLGGSHSISLSFFKP